MSGTESFLKEAFAGESQANQKYLAFAAVANKEGYKQIARFFRAAAAAETVHAGNHLKVLRGIKTTAENLKEAVTGETFEFEKMYPEMIEAAKAEGNKDAERSFFYANEVEKVHARIYQSFLDTMQKDEQDFPYYVCPVCGYTAEKELPGNCPVCGTKGSLFTRID